MSVRLNDGKGTAFRAVIATGCIGALLLALVLSAIPRLHEEIHGMTRAANHECAVTLLTSGNCQHAPAPAISVAPSSPPKAFVHVLPRFELVTAHLEFSLLEHAPPAIS